MSHWSGAGDDFGSRQHGEDLENERIGGPLYAEETRFPYEPKRGPKCVLTVADRYVDLAAPLSEGECEFAILLLIAKGYDAATARKLILRTGSVTP